MTKKELWAQYVAKNPSFDGEGKITLSAAGLRKLFHQTWDIAFHDGESEEDFQDHNPPSNYQSTESLEYLKKMFGM